MKSTHYHVLFAVLVLVVIFQPWSYNHRGFAEVTIAVAGGEIDLSLLNRASQSGDSYCLFSLFRTNDEPGEPVSIRIERVGTQSTPELAGPKTSSGKTFRVPGVESSVSYFQADGISKLVLPADEPLDVIGSVDYKGVTHRFRTSMKLKHWEKSRKVIKFCA